MRDTYVYFKRLCDLLASSLFLIFFSPLLLLIYICILLNMGHPVFFMQDRLGQSGSQFKLIKFRSMISQFHSNNSLLSDRQRTTRLGSFLRSTSLDELPSLLNILSGSMSFVGPRPMPVKYLKRFNKNQAKRMRVKPGLTGLAQINGRNNTTWSKRFLYDQRYVESQSFFLDLLILLRTFIVVLRRTGVNNSSSISMPEFTGDN